MRKKSADAIEHCIVEDLPNDEACGLQRLLDRAVLPEDIRSALREAVAAGFTLLTTWPHHETAIVQEWLGQRWWLMHRMYLSPWRWRAMTGIVGSRLSRTHADFRGWPSWIEAALRGLARDQQTLLLVPETATSGLLEPLARRANLDCLRVQLPRTSRRAACASPSLGSWLLSAIEQITASKSVANATLWVSPETTPAKADLRTLPLRDRVVVALAHRLLALSIRPDGNMAELIGQRLQDMRFSAGTVSVRLTSSPSSTNLAWLDRRAVGWYLPLRSDNPPVAQADACQHACERACTHSPTLTQWTAEAGLWQAQSEYLIHCVRGNDGDAFRNGEDAAVIDAIVRGQLDLAGPWDTLLQIVNTGRLRASGKLLRTGATAVSFTAVPLRELMARRRYQPHLGRWDWEPYGLMIRRDALAQLGARPVVYGDEKLFERLETVDRPYFQPARRRSAKRPQEHWQAEQEWRLLDDVRLSELPRDSLFLFVATRNEAQALAVHSAWPVLWQSTICPSANRTRQLPVAAESRRRSSSQTSRN